jgi:hypothetical protein
MNEPLDAAYEHLPPHIRKLAVTIVQQIALTAEPVKTTLEATFTEFLGQILLYVQEWKQRLEGDSMATPKKGADQMPASAPTIEEIAQRAYEIFLDRGQEPGHDVDDWVSGGV